MTRCAAGQKAVRLPTTISDTVCDACEEGSFNEDTSHFDLTCSNSTTACQPGSYVLEAPTSSSDRECRRCDPRLYSSTINSASCVEQALCDPGEYQIVAPSPTSDRTCGSKLVSALCLTSRCIHLSHLRLYVGLNLPAQRRSHSYHLLASLSCLCRWHLRVPRAYPQ